MTRRENPQSLEFIARVDVGCSTWEMMVNQFPCHYQLRTIPEVVHKQAQFLNKSFASSVYLTCVYTSNYQAKQFCKPSDFWKCKKKKRNSAWFSVQALLLNSGHAVFLNKIIKVRTQRTLVFLLLVITGYSLPKGFSCYSLRYLIQRPEPL